MRRPVLSRHPPQSYVHKPTFCIQTVLAWHPTNPDMTKLSRHACEVLRLIRNAEPKFDPNKVTLVTESTVDEFLKRFPSEKEFYERKKTNGTKADDALEGWEVWDETKQQWKTVKP
eukprot:TRINITY_DN4275_c0_g2_i1.p2 TRINITY_DN4275_c0_g2~~TRINITY_DN4275_c0_g2_i1.p2  ORF type:complete len:116 (+),score=5.73 TRINITY_DN4275_c0_g2_i1:980-1327(+)